MVEHAVGEVLVCLGFVVFNFSVPPILCRVLNNVEISNVDCALHGIWGVVIKEVFIKGEGVRITLGGSIDAKAFERFVFEVDLKTGSSARVDVGDRGGKEA